MRPAFRPSIAAVAAVALVAAVPVGASSAASTQQVREHVALKLVKRSGSTKFDHKGKATGTFPGAVRSKITLSHSVVLRGTVTITTKSGKVRMKVDGRARSLSLRTRFNGKATIVGGTGRYKNAKGSGKFSGVVNRSTWAATIDATGSFSY